MDAFDPATVYSSIDHGGRYAYANQPVVAEWNLARFAETLLPLLHEDQDKAVEIAVEALGAFRPTYSGAWLDGMRAKLGLPAGWRRTCSPGSSTSSRAAAVSHPDHTSLFRNLGAAAAGTSSPRAGCSSTSRPSTRG